MSEQLLAWLPLYGVPVLFGFLVVTSAGVPFPGTLMLLAVGSFVAQSEMNLWQVLIVGSAGAIVGDQIGYCLGLGAGRPPPALGFPLRVQLLVTGRQPDEDGATSPGR